MKSESKGVKPSFFFPLVDTPFIRETGEEETGEKDRLVNRVSLSVPRFRKFRNVRARQTFLKSFDNYTAILLYLHPCNLSANRRILLLRIVPNLNLSFSFNNIAKR